MTDNELLRIKVIQDICDKRLTGVEAAHLLNLSPRQVYRLVKRFIEFGASGLVSLQRGRPGNHRYDENVKLQTLAILHEHYTDFGPTLAHDLLRVCICRSNNNSETESLFAFNRDPYHITAKIKLSFSHNIFLEFYFTYSLKYKLR
ncbi:TPA: helix-turn-helix domain-containing protein [Photobacterium damselae]